jgi:hypothetical protein
MNYEMTEKNEWLNMFYGSPGAFVNFIRSRL